MFVPLAEEGWIDGPVPRQIAAEYLAEFHEHRVDALLLACTHYPLLFRTISEVMGPNVTVVDSAAATATAVAGNGNGAPAARSGPKIGRNDPCWCGSGKKYKRCHGA